MRFRVTHTNLSLAAHLPSVGLEYPALPLDDLPVEYKYTETFGERSNVRDCDSRRGRFSFQELAFVCFT